VLDISRRSLNIAGIRVTNQRSLIMDIIRLGEGHLDADEIYRRAHERDVGGVDKSIVVCYNESANGIHWR